MKRIIVIMLAVMFVISFSLVSSAQMPAGSAPAVKGEQQVPAKKFDDFKAGLLKRLDERIKRLTEEKACVEAAKDREELKKCRPERPEGPGGPGQHPPMGEPKK